MRSYTMVMFAFLTAILVLPGGAWGANTENVLYTFQGNNDCAPYGSLILDPAGNLYGTTYGGFVVNGEVYELSPSGSGWTETILHTFAGGSDGLNPVTGLVRDQAGNLYGTTPAGGSSDRGVVYELSPNGSGWTETVLYAFSGGNDGAIPYSGLILDQAGNLYGATSQGGTGGNGGNGVVFKLTRGSSGWTESVLYAFTGGNDGSFPQGNLLFDPAGDLYGTTMQGGVGGMGTAFKLTPRAGGWTKATLYGFTSGNDGSQPQAGVVRNSSGALYGTASTGGSGSAGVVYQLTPGSSGWRGNVLYTFTGGADGQFPESTVTIDSTGNLYGTTISGGTGCGVAYQIPAQR